MRRIDELHLELPFAGSRMLRDLRNPEGIDGGRKHVATLMRRMGIAAIWRRAKTRAGGIQPYIPMERGFVYLVAVIDWFSRKGLSLRVSNSLTADFCVDAFEEAIARYDRPEIFNTDQGSQFTGGDFIGVLKR